MIHTMPVPTQVTSPLSSVVIIPNTATGSRSRYCTMRYWESNKESLLPRPLTKINLINMRVGENYGMLNDVESPSSQLVINWFSVFQAGFISCDFKYLEGKFYRWPAHCGLLSTLNEKKLILSVYGLSYLLYRHILEGECIEKISFSLLWLKNKTRGLRCGQKHCRLLQIIQWVNHTPWFHSET